MLNSGCAAVVLPYWMFNKLALWSDNTHSDPVFFFLLIYLMLDVQNIHKTSLVVQPGHVETVLEKRETSQWWQQERIGNIEQCRATRQTGACLDSSDQSAVPGLQSSNTCSMVSSIYIISAVNHTGHNYAGRKWKIAGLPSSWIIVPDPVAVLGMSQVKKGSFGVKLSARIMDFWHSW